MKLKSKHQLKYLFLGVASLLFASLMYFGLLSLSLKKTSSYIPRPNQEYGETIVDSQTIVGISMLKDLALSQTPKQNVFISPLSINLAMYLALNGASHQTLIEMQQALAIKNPDLNVLNENAKSLVDQIVATDENIDIEIANSLWYHPRIRLFPDYVKKMNQYYSAEDTQADFGQQSGVNKVNNWVKEKTKGKIDGVLDIPNRDLKAVLINAIYFYGPWKYQFPEEMTTHRPFEKRQVPFMKNDELDVLYAEIDDSQVVALPYGKQAAYDLVIIKPNDIDSFIENLSLKKWKSMISKMSFREGTLYLPKFTLEYEKVLNQQLIDMGMKTAFTNSAQFPYISNDVSLKIDEVLHKTYLKVDERGSEAAAVTAVKMVPVSYNPNPPKSFIMDVNTPFVIAIRHKKTESLLFLGVIRNPVQ